MHAGDILVIEAAADTLASVLSNLGLKLESAGPPTKRDEDKNETDEAQLKRAEKPATASDEKEKEEASSPPTQSAEIALVEMVILPGQSLSGRSAQDIGLGTRYGLNLLAVSRQGNRSVARLRAMPLRAGDILLLQGPAAAISEFANDTGCVPLAERDLQIPNKRKAIQARRSCSPRWSRPPPGCCQRRWHSWPGPCSRCCCAAALAPALRRGGLAGHRVAGCAISACIGHAIHRHRGPLARGLMSNVAQGNATVALLLVLLVTMFLSDLMNNAATAAVMCPVAIGSATALGVNPDAFLMAVAIGASCVSHAHWPPEQHHDPRPWGIPLW
ncbi:MAG: TrkA C-terminal domain-containing protein [Burkholderiaceae bacterium]